MNAKYQPVGPRMFTLFIILYSIQWGKTRRQSSIFGEPLSISSLYLAFRQHGYDHDENAASLPRITIWNGGSRLAEQ